jgi:hypothetical protein
MDKKCDFVDFCALRVPHELKKKSRKWSPRRPIRPWPSISDWTVCRIFTKFVSRVRYKSCPAKCRWHQSLFSYSCTFSLEGRELNSSSTAHISGSIWMKFGTGDSTGYRWATTRFMKTGAAKSIFYLDVNKIFSLFSTFFRQLLKSFVTWEV